MHAVSSLLNSQQLSYVRVRVYLLGDEQADLLHAHQFGPALHCGCADVWDDAGQRCVLVRRYNDQHADGVAMIRQLDHLVFEPLRRSGHA